MRDFVISLLMRSRCHVLKIELDNISLLYLFSTPARNVYHASLSSLSVYASLARVDNSLFPSKALSIKYFDNCVVFSLSWDLGVSALLRRESHNRKVLLSRDPVVSVDTRRYC